MEPLGKDMYALLSRTLVLRYVRLDFVLHACEMRDRDWIRARRFETSQLGSVGRDADLLMPMCCCVTAG